MLKGGYTLEKYSVALPYTEGDDKPEPCVLASMTLVSQNGKEVIPCRSSPGPSAPMILLEKCESPLKSWLKEQDMVNEEVQDAMIDFTTDIARALKHLHDSNVGIRA